MNDQCATFNNAGLCTSCYKGYDLEGGICVLSAINSVGPFDLGCA